jgi:hypothetical protein
MRLRMLMAMCLTGCTVVDHQYPAAWDALPPAAAGSCARFAGSYADRGESSGTQTEPSLARGLFGTHSAWKQVTRVDLSLPEEGVVTVTAWDGDEPLIEHKFTAAAGDFSCEEGRLVLRSKRWVVEDIVAGRQRITIEFSDAAPQLVAHVKESTYGTIFAVVPIAGTASRWYRFPRMPK